MLAPLRGCEFFGNPKRERGTPRSPQVTISAESTLGPSLTLRVTIENSPVVRKITASSGQACQRWEGLARTKTACFLESKPTSVERCSQAYPAKPVQACHGAPRIHSAVRGFDKVLNLPRAGSAVALRLSAAYDSL
jgi:hypothetical protein